MDIDREINGLRVWLNGIFNSDWLGTALLAVAFVAITALCSHLVTLSLRRMLKSNRGPVPSASIFVNIARVCVWAAGLSIMLSSCFNINVQAAITALGVGGIAVSLGFQSTLSNLIGGMQIVLAGIVEPGDRIRIATHEGIVHDITWRQTTIITDKGDTVIVPNSVINTEALVKIAQAEGIASDEALGNASGDESGKTLVEPTNEGR